MKELEKWMNELDRWTICRKEEKSLRVDGFTEKIGQIRLMLEEEAEGRTRLEN